MDNNEETVGEDLIADFFEEKGIKAKRYPTLPRLDDDAKWFRKPDFYLPEYKVYVEFLGQWDKPEHQKRYKQKMAVYHKNKIPCVYLWSDNLGTLDWILRRRLREVLLKYNKRWTLLKYECGNYIAEYSLRLVGIGFLIYFIKHTSWRIAIILYLLYTLYISTSKYIKRLLRLKKSKWVSGIGYNNRQKVE